MIHVERKDPPDVLVGENSKGVKEYTRWREYMEGKREKRPGFTAYADPRVKDALLAMFHKKCAYCDRSTTVGDVEHWRPKNAVSSEDNKKLSDGYWWLAARWENLLFSCMECNQCRNREMEGESGLSMAGKGTQFPLDDEKKRAKDVGKEKDETPLLLNPCDDDPAKYMKIALQGDETGVLQPLLDTDEHYKRARTSIDIFGLNEFSLVQRRVQLLNDLQNRIEYLNEQFASLSGDLTTPKADEIFAKIEDKLTQLMAFLDDERENMLLIRQVVVPYLKGLRNETD